MNPDGIVKAVSFLLWADGKIEESEMIVAEKIFSKYKFEWEDVKPLLEKNLEDLISVKDKNNDIESEEDFQINKITIEEGIDNYEFLIDLAELACSDKIIDYQEVEMLHRIGTALDVQPELICCAMLKAAYSSKSKVELN